ncbi:MULTISPECIES: META domain-containing protein [Pseudonocardia]|uniref:DUF306 domain-containing protein n=2 Tax=Pseudonocardia TaxID=1847 RepID=A0A1Y2MVE2_PSEAH|nr:MULTISPECIES: META domain-containing protein [Pseudonocardia]OSY38939.1 hypothetical protein BG845_03811 [Pseudonocardia autotrophica]TDN76195.1 META domain-containing protein [Pseudonocardia autotrophica]BBG00176.1 hypothetical protein Pdca_13850 [Pseudonocardia autotrophica]GEC26755.1 hypothetical protein PSA01_37840 [Pseudonocardia saturnea]
MTSRILLGVALVAVLALLGCANTPASAAGPGDGGPRPATAADLIGGHWYPADGTAQGRAFAEFAADGSWTGSDGCNGQSGTWALEDDGAFTGAAGMSTMIGCENVPVAFWIDDAVLAEIDDGDLVLHDAAGDPVRLVRELA